MSRPNVPEAPQNASRPLSHSETARALRAFLYTSGMWGVWGRMVGIGTAAFTGYALWLGATDAHIAYFVSIAHFTSLVQLASSALINRVRHRKASILLLGGVEILLRSAVVLIPLFVIAEGRVLTMGVILAMGLACGQLISPVYNEWLATTIPGDIRGRFTGRQTIAQLIPGILTAYAVGWYLDLFGETERFTGFFTVFTGATLLGLGGYLNLMRVPFRQSAPDAAPGNLFAPFRDRRFRNLLLFFLSWNFALGIAGPFYSIFMLKTLAINYANVELLNSIFMAAMVVGYKIWGGLVDRYGSKALLRIMVAPTALVPVLWTFNRPDSYLLIPAAMLLNGLLQAGILVSINPLLYSLLPEGQGKAAYFAAWSCAIQLAFSVAPLLGSALAGAFEPVRFSLLGYPVGNLQIVFLASATTLLIPPLLLRAVEDVKDITPAQLLAHVGRGNLLSYIYGSFTFDRTSSERARAQAVRRMGRSRSPMALDRLIKALDDASPEVRRQAARGLGEAGASEAVSHLVEELADEESDIRSEAAEALGKIGDPAVIDPLLEALDDTDTRVQISAITALSEIGSEEANELLFWKFADRFNRITFPALADALSRARDLRMVRPTLERLRNYRSPAIRLQLLNGVCRALGARRQFYQLISRDELSRAESLVEMIRQTHRAFKRSRAVRGEARKAALADMDEILNAFDAGDAGRLSTAIHRLMDNLQAKIGGRAVEALGENAASRIGAVVLAVKTFFKTAARREPEDVRTVFLVVCLWCLGDALESAR